MNNEWCTMNDGYWWRIKIEKGTINNEQWSMHNKDEQRSLLNKQSIMNNI